LEDYVQNIWITIGIIAAAAALTLPLAAIVLVSLASIHEESAQTLSRQAPGPTSRAARRLLGFHTESSVQQAVERTADRAQRPSPEVRFAHARRPLPDFRQLPPLRQPRPSAVFVDHRQGAGV
jgi:hypothetical protein